MLYYFLFIFMGVKLGLSYLEKDIRQTVSENRVLRTVHGIRTIGK